MYWKKGSQLDKVVVKLQTKASLHVLRLQVIPALKAVENTDDDDDDSSKHVLRTTTMAAADDMSSETIRAMHQAQVLVLRMLEGSVADQSPPEDTSMVLEYQRAMEAHFRSKAQSLERDSEDQKDQVRTLHDVAAKAQLRVEAYKRNASPCICDTGCVKQAGECTDKIPTTTAVDHLAQLKHEMSQRLQSQIDYTK
ncbi:hypothetical protein DYB34_003509 [Aphanomyces astaci]|uniref:Uncharacterized protein n=1 Tax=Aphanomyces astaci TaxID=112090 RepID=A0A418CD98_APHAT|nr:hypothetical protein DYB34_003509 [Aphanomyces astaci]